MPIIGAHVSVAGGIDKCFANAKKIGAESIQIFGANPRQWKGTVPGEERIAAFKREHTKSGLGPVFLHASYLVNLGSPDNKIYHGSIGSLVLHLQIAEMIGAEGLIFHIGSAKNSTKAAAVARVAEGMKRTLEKVPGKSRLIMENAAGGGMKIGATPEEIGAIFQKVKSPRVKVCIDTAHAFEAGVLKTFSKDELDEFTRACDKAFGWKHIVALHVNDSKTPFGSNNDRHENIGEGEIGLEAFRNLAHHPKFNKLPWILETPGFGGTGPDRRNIAVVRALLGK
ncbi:MAG: hypothetical protein A3C90_04240 [Candidatus Magasanikbacteria bacterium RIFCSPHIGHO2_02_FULL_51_14]|uniref:Probable endonuclease 4 n=1 Tax=Candidatus Magasanikbacteria bacterium RIFCSPHIGHO2_02_FULL_51_14 TaxID=1798683 RepID=A0A1F6MG38_9BACT|nr:MAG: hypothetical protein A3C90_04240 [Candidatus Magasanikbacteria bacterium RIFCSPHIGHO2_02_FULL_51_14]